MGFWCFSAGAILVVLSYGIINYRDGRRWDIASTFLMLGGLFIWTVGKEKCEADSCYHQTFQHNRFTDFIKTNNGSPSSTIQPVHNRRCVRRTQMRITGLPPLRRRTRCGTQPGDRKSQE